MISQDPSGISTMKKVAHLGDRSGCPEVHGQHRKHENRCEDLRNDFQHLVAAAQDDRHGNHSQEQAVHPELDRQPHHFGAHVVHDGRQQR